MDNSVEYDQVKRMIESDIYELLCRFYHAEIVKDTSLIIDHYIYDYLCRIKSEYVVYDFIKLDTNYWRVLVNPFKDLFIKTWIVNNGLNAYVIDGVK